MNLREITEKTKKKEFEFLVTPSDSESNYKIRIPLTEMFGLKPKKRWLDSFSKWTNGYTPEDMIPTNKLAPILQLKEGKDVVIKVGREIKISAEDVKKRQEGIDLIYDKDHISAEEVHHIQLIKAGRKCEVQEQYNSNKKCGSFEDYINQLESKASYVVIRAEVKQYLDYLGDLLDEPIESVFHYTTFPKLVEGSLDYGCFTEDSELKDESPLKDKFESIIKLNALMAAQHREGLSLVIPNAYFHGLKKDGQRKAKEIFVKAVIGTAEEIKQDSEKYSGFRGIFINTGNNNKDLNKLIEESGIESIAINYGDLSAPSRVSKEGKFAQSIMGEGVGYVGNGALSAMGNIAVEETLTRKTLGETVLMFSGGLNENVLNKERYREESVRSDRVRNKTKSIQYENVLNKERYREKSVQSDRVRNKTKNIQCNRSTVCFAVAVSLSSLIVALTSVTQTYIFLATLIIPAAIGLYGWSLYKEEQKNKLSSNIENNTRIERAGHNMIRRDRQGTLSM